MSFFKLCNNDDLLILLQETFKAFPIKIPEERIKPMIVYSGKNKKYKYIGKIEKLLEETSPINIQSQTSQMANLSATKSRSIDAKLGLQVMDGFLKGFGVQGTSIDFAFEGVQKISFSFQNVSRSFIDVGELCNVLSNRKFNLDNPVNKTFLDESARCIIIDSVITSDNFSISVEKSSQNNFKFDVSAIENILNSNDNKISTKSLSNLNISFQGETALAFAFSGFIINCDVDGSLYFDGELDKMHLTAIPDNRIIFPPKVDFLDSDFGLLELE